MTNSEMRAIRNNLAGKPTPWLQSCAKETSKVLAVNPDLDDEETRLDLALAILADRMPMRDFDAFCSQLEG